MIRMNIRFATKYWTSENINDSCASKLINNQYFNFNWIGGLIDNLPSALDYLRQMVLK